MNEPLGYFITWTTYGTWLRGDGRCWVDKHHNQYGTPYDQPEPAREDINRLRMRESPVLLSSSARQAVEAAICQTCQFKGWMLHAANARSNHIHVVVTATGVTPGQCRER